MAGQGRTSGTRSESARRAPHANGPSLRPPTRLCRSSPCRRARPRHRVAAIFQAPRASRETSAACIPRRGRRRRRRIHPGLGPGRESTTALAGHRSLSESSHGMIRWRSSCAGHSPPRGRWHRGRRRRSPVGRRPGTRPLRCCSRRRFPYRRRSVPVGGCRGRSRARSWPATRAARSARSSSHRSRHRAACRRRSPRPARRIPCPARVRIRSGLPCWSTQCRVPRTAADGCPAVRGRKT